MELKLGADLYEIGHLRYILSLNIITYYMSWSRNIWDNVSLYQTVYCFLLC